MQACQALCSKPSEAAFWSFLTRFRQGKQAQLVLTSVPFSPLLTLPAKSLSSDPRSQPVLVSGKTCPVSRSPLTFKSLASVTSRMKLTARPPANSPDPILTIGCCFPWFFQPPSSEAIYPCFSAYPPPAPQCEIPRVQACPQKRQRKARSWSWHLHSLGMDVMARKMFSFKSQSNLQNRLKWPRIERCRFEPGLGR